MSEKHEVKLGSLISGAEERDAIHIAVCPVVAAELLLPGERIGFAEGSQTEVVRDPSGFGIVDPFLSVRLGKGDVFWAMLMPNTITSLRHEWTHPLFGEKPIVVTDKAASEKWLREFSETTGLSYEDVLGAAEDYIVSGDVLVQYDQDDARDAFYSLPSASEFWRHYSIVTGKEVPESDQDGCPFSCSC